MKTKMSSFYTVLLVLYQIIDVYKSPVKLFSIADLLLIIFFIFGFLYLLKFKRKTKLSPVLLYAVILMTTHEFLIILINGFVMVDFLSFLRVLLYYLSILLFYDDFFDYNIGYNTYKKVSLFSSIYIIFQYIFMVLFHKYIPGTIPFLKIEENLQRYNLRMQYTLFDRPRSLFIEPSHFAIYVSIFLIIYLMRNEKVDIKIIFILSLGILISGSSTGIGLLIISLICFFIKNLRLTRENIKSTLIVVVVTIISVLIFINSKSFIDFINRTFKTKLAFNGRFSTMDLLYNNDFSKAQKVFGIGFFKNDIFYPSVIRIFLFHGYFGLVTYILLLIFSFFKSNKIGKAIIILFLIISLSSSIVYSRLVLLIYPFIMSNRRKNIKVGKLYE